MSALVPYKRIDLAIDACRRVGAPLRIVGDGPDRERLRSASPGPDVTFLGPLTDEQMRDEYRRAQAVHLPGEEDFGIVPVEAQACGRPVVALARGGALETVTDGETGVLFAEPTRGVTRRRAATGGHDVVRPVADSAPAPSGSRAIATLARCEP